MKYRWHAALWMLFFSAGYLATFAPGFPLVKYYPVEHAWGLDGAYAGPAMGWFCRVAVGCLAGLLGWTIGMFAAKRATSSPRPPLPVEIAAWMLALAAAACATHEEWAKWM